MKHVQSILVALFITLFASASFAMPDVHGRLLVHGKAKISKDTKFGFGSWIILPYATTNPSIWIAGFGPRYDHEDWYVEILGGGEFTQGHVSPMIDINFELSPTLFGKPIFNWTDIQYFFQSGKECLMVYSMLDYVLMHEALLIGIETENYFQNGKDVLSIGPSGLIHLGKLELMFAYQFHYRNHNEIWVRSVLHF
jgi:hypothetical protein